MRFLVDNALSPVVARVWKKGTQPYSPGSPIERPRRDEARSLDQVRAALEAQGGRTVLGLYASTETRTGSTGDYRRCTATVVTSKGEAHIGFTIGWHDRQNGIPFWTGDGL